MILHNLESIRFHVNCATTRSCTLDAHYGWMQRREVYLASNYIIEWSIDLCAGISSSPRSFPHISPIVISCGNFAHTS